MWALRGTVVTMDDAATVHRDGIVWIGDDGRIAAVAAASEATPAGFEAVTPVRSGGVIYPGLIDLHNHLPYNTIGLWKDKDREAPYGDHNQWPRAGSYGPDVSRPGGFLGWVTAPSLIAYVEMKAIVGGTTTVQGNGKVNHTVDGALARNIDSERFGTKKDFFRVTTIPPDKASELVPIAQAMTDKRVGFVYHLAEGVDPKLLKEWTVAFEGGVVQRGLVAIHATALGPEQLAVLAANDSTVVWSPFSNLWLYGGTLDVRAAKAAGVRLCLGADWAPSGTKNVLGELKVAALCNADPGAWRQPPDSGSGAGGPLFDDLELCRMVTSNPGDTVAAVAGPQIGRLEPGWLADLVVTRKRVADPYRNLIRATERDVRLVVIGGEARYGIPALVRSAGATEPVPVRVGSLSRAAVIRNPQNAETFMKWTDVVKRLEAVRKDPPAAAREIALALAAVGGDLSHPDAPLVVFGDMPMAGGAPDIAGRNDPPQPVPIPELQSLVHDAAWFDAVDAHPFHRGLLSPMRDFYR